MRLAKPFYRLPVRFDAERLRAEVAALPPMAWASHPNEIEGNSSVRLISANGGENDDVNGTMLPTPHLQQCPYMLQVLASFGVVWSRSRLMRLQPHAVVPEHADINYHWFNRVRLHIPVVTRPEVQFHCGGQVVHMAAGEAWVFDNWRRHRVDNPTDDIRIHLVADTSGTSTFWQFVAQSEQAGIQPRQLAYDPGRNVPLLTERAGPRPVMIPAEVDLLTLDMRNELTGTDDTAQGRAQLGRYHALLDGFARDWRQLYLLHGESEAAAAEYGRLRDALRTASRALGEGLSMRTNKVGAHSVLEGRLLRHLLNFPSEQAPPPPPARAAARPAVNLERPAHQSRRPTRAQLQRPLFIVAAPRSGSTLLFETLAVTPQLCTLGGEAHWLVESNPQLKPGAPGVDSNRLTAEHCSPELEQRIVDGILDNLKDANGQPVETAGAALSFLEKTPKNALRIPFFVRVFPDARFIYLWREPQGNLGSIIDAWRAGDWTTYRELEGWEGTWSMLLPPGWQALRGRPLEEIAAYQWECTNRIVLEDLQALARDRWTPLRYEDLLADPAKETRRLCEFAGIQFDAALSKRVSGTLPLARYTHTPPRPDKWRRHEAAITRVLPSMEATWQRLQAL
jgi:hypothetical protein